MAMFGSLLLASLLGVDAGVDPTAAVHQLSWLADADVFVHPAIDRVQRRAQDVLADQGLVGMVQGRVKTAASLSMKASLKGVSTEQIHDRLGVRVIVADDLDCYLVRDAMHAQLAVVPASVDDYIAHPKANGYQSLHSTLVMGDELVELQVRSVVMHANAEVGGAAHDVYKAQQRALAGV